MVLLVLLVYPDKPVIRGVGFLKMLQFYVLVAYFNIPSSVKSTRLSIMLKIIEYNNMKLFMRGHLYQYWVTLRRERSRGRGTGGD